ncbi:uncharacterized protein LOC135120757 [Zophobas morio]|uniref:uncharacterized protein LOC135120757 n=1 Tax=Zophobas morio TaxID=2755281 RepID=UPI0030833674
MKTLEELRKKFRSKNQQNCTQPSYSDETELFKARAKLWRYDMKSSDWKERGTGEIKLIKSNKNGLTRALMLRDKTFTVCCNYYLTPEMKLEVHCSHPKTWIYTVLADFSDNVCKTEVHAIRFLTVDVANLFLETFNSSKENNHKIFTEKSSGSKLARELGNPNGEPAEEKQRQEISNTLKELSLAIRALNPFSKLTLRTKKKNSEKILEKDVIVID